ncbi:soluble scavenger receptor cysteine-rich domain-containing protein SSC5D-like isoform X2 [Daphnia pulex]|uniref:soluble scavenger receptor cysteine-rich domain-containing protein SSC5D-like isoform X2 n=1 Tax=Daphnia pulex TaxID=6669 RepID=UPI001EDED69E|nr:soluble scavenger receptor cysteine-rich domain-containing protein SSC5D-like isoform X2 [Daphnia pulex]
MNKGLSIFALMIGAALFIAQMPFHSEAAPVDEPQFLSIDLADMMEDGLTTPSPLEDESVTLATDVEDDRCLTCPTKTTPHHTKPTTKPTHPTKKTKPTTKPTKPTHPTKKTKPTTRKPCPTVCYPHPVCPPCQHPVEDEVEVAADDDDAVVEKIAPVVDFE